MNDRLINVVETVVSDAVMKQQRLKDARQAVMTYFAYKAELTVSDVDLLLALDNVCADNITCELEQLLHDACLADDKFCF